MKSPIRIPVEYTFLPAQKLIVRSASIRVPLRGPFKPAVIFPPCGTTDKTFVPSALSQRPQQATLEAYTWPGVAHFFSGQREKLETGLVAWRHFCKGLMRGSPHD